jgi:hypothetical protein
MPNESAVIETVDVDEVRQYLARHDIHLLFESLAADLVRARPDEPVKFLHEALGKLLHEGGTKSPGKQAP